jgi:hypothetical protein
MACLIACGEGYVYPQPHARQSGIFPLIVLSIYPGRYKLIRLYPTLFFFNAVVYCPILRALLTFFHIYLL